MSDSTGVRTALPDPPADTWVRGLVALHVVTRVGLWLGGLDLSLRPLEVYWQVADVALLRDAPLETLWNLHAQPPLYNAVIAAVEQVPAGLREPIYRLGLAAASLIVVLTTNVLARRLGASPRVAGIAAVLVSLSPQLITHELLLFYTVPVAAMLGVMFVALAHAANAPRGAASRAAAVGFAAGAGICLTRSLFHLVWLVALAGVFLVWQRASTSLRGRATTVAIVGPCLVVAAWYAHVWVGFGVAQPSSWLGQSLALTTIGHLTPVELDALVEDGTLTDLARLAPFEPPVAYAEFVDLPAPTGVPILDQVRNAHGAPNLHNAGVPAVSAAYQRLSLGTVRAQPVVLARQAGKSTCFLLRPADQSILFNDFEGSAGVLQRTYRRTVLLQPRHAEAVHRCTWGNGGWQTLSLTAMLLVIAPLAAAALALRRRLAGNGRADDLVIVLAGLTIAFVVAVSSFSEIGENYRFRFLVEPLGWAVTAAMVSSARDRLTARRAPSPTS